MGVRAFTAKDRPLVTPDITEEWKPSDRVIGILLKNQGTDTVRFSLSNTAGAVVLQPDEEKEYGNLSGGNDIFYLNAKLKYAYDDNGGTQGLLLTETIDLGPVSNC